MRRKHIKRRYVVAASVIVAAVAVLISEFLPSRQQQIAPRAATTYSISVRLQGPFDPAFAGEMVAARAGLFEREGLHVALKPGGPEADPMGLVAGGADTIGVADAERFFLARARGVPIVAFAAGYLESAVAFYALEQSGIRTPQDFIDRRVGYRAGHATAMMYEALMTRLQLPRGQVREVAVGSDYAPLFKGELDVWPGSIAAEGFTFKQKQIRFNEIRPSNYGLHVPGTVYFTTEGTVRDNPELLRRFLRAVIAGWGLAYADYDKSIPLIAAFDDKALAPDYIRFKLERQRDILRPLGTRFGEFDLTRWRSLQDILLQQKLLKEPIDLSRAVTFDILRDAYRKPSTFAN
jgi:ABC-type nitrate/sulfonate/bicarbonate transport system substrate-binding protein